MFNYIFLFLIGILYGVIFYDIYLIDMVEEHKYIKLFGRVGYKYWIYKITKE